MREEASASLVQSKKDIYTFQELPHHTGAACQNHVLARRSKNGIGRNGCEK
ncbi:MAG: hypothetical protein ACLUVG_05030 [Phocaeicola vulgatus]